MTRPAMNERHIARTYRSVFLPANLWAIGVNGGTVANNVITLAESQFAGTQFVPPYDLDPSFAVKFRIHFTPQAAQAQNFSLKTTLLVNDGAEEGFVVDPSTITDLTTPIPSKTTTAPMNGMLCVTLAGSLTLPSTTRRNWSAALYLTGATVANPPLIYGVEVAYVPMIAGVFHDVAPSAAAWAS